MNTFKPGTKQYEVVNTWLEMPVEALAAKIGKQEPKMQMMAIDTMYQIIATDRHYMQCSAGTLVVQIRNGQRERLAHYGDKAYGLSEKQIAVIAADIDRLTNTWTEEE